MGRLSESKKLGLVGSKFNSASLYCLQGLYILLQEVETEQTSWVSKSDGRPVWLELQYTEPHMSCKKGEGQGCVGPEEARSNVGLESEKLGKVSQKRVAVRMPFGIWHVELHSAEDFCVHYFVIHYYGSRCWWGREANTSLLLRVWMVMAYGKSNLTLSEFKILGLDATNTLTHNGQIYMNKRPTITMVVVAKDWKQHKCSSLEIRLWIPGHPSSGTPCGH